MLTNRIVPILLYDGKFCVHTKQFKVPARRLGPVTQFVENMANRDIDELVLLDISATKENREPNFKQIKEFTEKLFCPVAYGGGISDLADIQILIQECGVDKVIIKTNFALMYAAANKFGSQSIVYACDVKDGKVDGLPPKSKIKYKKWLKIIQDEGAGEIILTDINQQGTLGGYNLDMIGITTKELKIPLIANGGCGSYQDMIAAIEYGASAVAASTLFCLRDVTPQDCAVGMRQEAGLPVRLPVVTQT